MEMFQDGGLMDEGGTVDPVSGNDVPPGSNQEEVRDDIPAQLSEGEFVFPADVVRFIGLEKLMMIRQRAKAGLQRMDDMGQMGNSEEAVMPDDLPFSIDDLDMEDDGLEMAQGGVVHMANGGSTPNPNAGVFYNPASQPTTGVAAAPVQAASSNIARSIPIAQAATPTQAGSSNQPAMFNNYALKQAPVPVMPQRDDLPAFLGEVTPGVGGGVDYVNEVYENEAGATQTFRRYTDDRLLDKNGAVAVIPEGYTIKSEADKKVTVDPTKVKTATVKDLTASENDDDDGLGQGGARVGWGGTTDGSGLKTGSTQVGISFSNTGNLSVPSMLSFAGGRFTGKDIPAGVGVGMTVGGVTTNISAADFNTAKAAGYMGSFSDGLLNQAQVNAEVAGKVSSKYGLNKTQGTFESFYEAARESKMGVSQLADKIGIDLKDIKSGIFGFGKDYDDLIDKAVEESNKRGREQGFYDQDITKEDMIAAHNAIVNDATYGTGGQGVASDPSGRVSGGADQEAADTAREDNSPDTSRGEESSPGAGDATDE